MSSQHRKGWISRDLLLGGALLGAVTLYRPLVLWGNNPWDLSAPERIFVVALVEFGIILAVLLLVSRWTNGVFRSAVLIGTTALVLLNTQLIDSLPKALVLAALTVAALVLATLRRGSGPLWVALFAVLLLVISPSIHVVSQHIENRVSYPIAISEMREPINAHSEVEDVLVLIVDGYPMAEVAKQWFGHDTEVLRHFLSARGFTAPSMSWSHNTSTSLAIPSILQASQVATLSDDADWRNQKSVFGIVQGGNLVVSNFRNAGFHYTHIESGWNGGICGRADTCLRSTWMDGANWAMLGSSAMAPMMNTSFGSPHVVGTRQTVDHLASLELFGDGRRDLVYAHLLLPHAPRVVDHGCNVKPEKDRPQGPSGVRDQLACVDSLLTEVIDNIADDAAVLIAADHGTATHSQDTTLTQEWTDGHIAERLGAFLAYRMPLECRKPAIESNVNAMRALLACASGGSVPANEPSFVIGLENPALVEPSRLARIESQLSPQEVER